MNKADYIFETSWEICNKVGGIYTVLSTKAFTVVEQYKNNYICIGPDLSKENNAHGDFVEDSTLFRNWKEIAHNEGLRIRIGRWKVSGNPIVILVDFTPFYEKKNDILTQFWLKYKLDSISGQWDYIEPALFGYAAGKVIESFYQFHCTSMDKIIAHFHEWMTGTGILHLESVTPQIATVFTTHATVLGRCIAGNGLPLYDNLEQYHPQEAAAKFGVQSKFSLEHLSAKMSDAFTTVSDITNQECEAFFNQEVDCVTINGFENNFVPKEDEYQEKRMAARKKLLHVASSLIQQEIPDNALLLVNSGRYEFRNKGIDLFIEALARLSKNPSLDREVVAFIMVPAGTSGNRMDLIKKMQDPISSNPITHDYTTHPLYDPDQDPIIQSLNHYELNNAPECKIKVIFVPVYLNGEDGIFNMDYYDLLIGFDLSAFPSYYEPWGYTPLESVAFGIPTITTSLAGFGIWAKEKFGDQKSVWVIERRDDNNDEVSTEIAHAIYYYTTCDRTRKEEHDTFAIEIAQHALWKNLYVHYLEAYDKAIQKSVRRIDQYQNKTSKIGLLVDKIKKPEPKWRRISVKSNLPESLKKLELLANNLWWS
ncbi:MAG: glycogen/starch synthase, partial [Bacteroidales bacterium]